jgi:hypothetical protein
MRPYAGRSRLTGATKPWVEKERRLSGDKSCRRLASRGGTRGLRVCSTRSAGAASLCDSCTLRMGAVALSRRVSVDRAYALAQQRIGLRFGFRNTVKAGPRFRKIVHADGFGKLGDRGL